ncbi:hypothetical protein BX616_002608 [Lobosporangium transversale]|nr:hypothetical protein BX616_002608 [Lobosporangium transversale]
MVFHRKCQFYVGNTCFPGPHLSYFQSGTPVPSLPNLKVLANGKVKGGSRPSSRASQLNVDDRSRSATPSQGLSPRPCPTPPLSIFSKRETTTINESSEHSRVISPVPPLPLPQLPLTSVQRTMSPEGYLTHADPYNSQNQIQGQSMRPPSRQCDSPTSPTFSGLRNLISGGGRRFSFSKKGTSASNAHPLPTPPTSYSSNPTPSAVASPSVHVRQQAGTPDSSKTPRQPPTTPPKTLPVPITGNNNNNKVNLNDSAGRKYRGRLYHPGPGPLDPLDDNDINVIGHFSRSHQRPSSINIFSTSAPPVHTDYMAVAGRRLGAGAGVLGSRHSASSLKKYGDDEFDGNDEQEQKRVDSDDDDRNGHDGIDDMEEEDLEGMLIPSVARTPRSSVDAGHPVVVTNGGGHHRVNSHQSFGQALSHKQMQLSREPPSPPPRLPRSNIAAYHQNDFPRPHSGAKSPAMRSSLQQTQQSQQQPSLSGGGRSQLNSGYSSSGSSSAALTSSYSSTQSNNSSSASSLGSVAALLEEEERAMKEIQQQQYHSGGARSKNAMLNVPTGFHLATQPREAHHVGIRTMLNRFSASNKDHNNGYDRPLSVHDKEKEKETQLLQQHRDISNKSPLNAYNNINSMSTGAIKHQIQAPTQYQQLHGQALAGVRSIHPLQQQHQTRLPEARMSNSTEFDNIVGQRTKFAQGYELSHHQLEAANGTLLQNATNAWRASSPGGIHYSADSTSSSTILPPSSSSHANGLVGGGAEAALSALKRGRKVIRRSMGATLEKEHWD